MGKVRRLSEVLARQIAAGEIVERPASVVKELVENSLDAESSQVQVQLLDGGKERIRVQDDGFGMSAEDAELAFQHHATSKIESLEDLHRISTLGFRGEALPSIASVSKTLLRTVDREGEEPRVGTELEVIGGETNGLRPISWPGGTEITVDHLFFNVPARRKFLKTTATELNHVSRLMMSYALGHPEVAFSLQHGDRKILEVPKVSRLEDRIFQVLGESLFRNLISLSYESEGVRVYGFTSLPHEQRQNGNSLHLFVNRRVVRDRMMTHALRQGYKDLIPSQAYPVTVLFLETDPQWIDVNVHPTKTEIRFRQSQQVYRAILQAVEEALATQQTDLGSLARDLSLEEGPRRENRIRGSLEAFLNRSSSGTFFERGSHPYMQGTGGESAVSEGERQRPVSTRDPHSDAIPETAHISSTPVVLGQFVESFLVAVDREGVMVVDQHVAHERILFDRLLRTLNGSDRVAVQRLLVPITLELNPQQRSIAEKVLEHLNENGFEVEWFGRDALIVRGVPALAKNLDVQEVLNQLFAELDELEDLSRPSNRNLQRLREKIAISLSCRNAIKINTPLSGEKMQWLIDSLFSCENPYTCPHGRPIVVRLNLTEILRGFKRI